MRWFALALCATWLSACSMLNAAEPVVGSPAPDFVLNNLQGEPVRLSELRGQPVLLNFWATWCGPCRQEMPTIQARYNQGGFAVLAVDFAESRQQVQGFLDEIGVDLPVLLDSDGSVQELYRVRGYPSTFFIDAQGIIRFFHIGELSAADIDTYLRQMDSSQ
ncbi:MAG TPA: TlpA disulfide reductase family protein [Anaerolineales bacterium]|nr:TlpA disulfide reductase family protein [Anaerolineales bacterium]HRQ91413.1 TlpA disulfide reductase family protein [Anaerolineales bacterium]